MDKKNLTVGNVISRKSEQELQGERSLVNLLKNTPIPDDSVLNHLGLFINRQLMSRIIGMHDIYKQITKVHGIVCEFGVFWGQNLALFELFRSMYEPCSYNRKIVGFDTFEGFVTLNQNDGDSPIIKHGAYSTAPGYELHWHKSWIITKIMHPFHILKNMN